MLVVSFDEHAAIFDAKACFHFRCMSVLLCLGLAVLSVSVREVLLPASDAFLVCV